MISTTSIKFKCEGYIDVGQSKVDIATCYLNSSSKVAYSVVAFIRTVGEIPLDWMEL
jgi:hypothetical protein